MRPVTVLGICGSLRRQSNNAALLRAIARLAPPQLDVHLYAEAGALPLFNPDLDAAALPVVHRLWDAVTTADALVIASPEYAHGVTGVIKNLLDWLVALPAFYGKPVAVLNASPRARHADAALRETVRTMSAIIVEPASITLPVLGSGLDEDGIVASPGLSAGIRAALAALRAATLATPCSLPVAFGNQGPVTGS